MSSITQDKVKIVLAGLVIILTLVLLITLFKGSRMGNYPYKELLAAKDSIIEAQKKQREILEAEIIEREISFEALETLDSITYVHYREFQKIHKLLDEKLKIIPITIAGIRNNNDSIRAAFSKF